MDHLLINIPTFLMNMYALLIITLFIPKVINLGLNLFKKLK
jgi:hypothetical protein